MEAVMRCWILLGALVAVVPGCGETVCEPGAAEVCNNVDDNCNGQIDEGLETQGYYADSDGDGYGTISAPVAACALPDGYAENGDDCNDTDAEISPAAAEVCESAGEPIDNDCDGLIDADDGSLSGGVIGYLDADEDGYGGVPGFAFCSLPSGFIEEGGDCDDFDDEITTGWVWYVDEDGDGFGDEDQPLQSCDAPSEGYSSNDEDCDDSDEDVSPAAEEICDDGVDNNCDGGGGDCAPLSGDVSIETADAILSGAERTFGLGISSADFNQDGVMNVLTADSDGYSGAGAVYVFGQLDQDTENATSSALLTLYGSANAPVGLQVAATEDLTGDGVPDIATMFSNEDIVLHSGDVVGVQDIYSEMILIEGTEGSDTHAGQMGSADFSGDGSADLLIGSPNLSDSNTKEGRAYLFPGPITSSTTVTEAQVTIYGDFGSWSVFGYQVASAGDTNGDGLPEAMISAEGSSTLGTTYGGAVYLFEGSTLAGVISADEADFSLIGTQSSGYFGHDISGGRDVNGDGYDDVLIGASSSSSGAAYVFFGPLDEMDEDANADTVIDTDESGSYLGWRVAMAGDLNDDGTDDIAFTELLSDYRESSGGAVGLAFGPLSGNTSLQTADAVIYPDSSVNLLGQDVHGVGDVNGDGIDDLAVGGYYSDTIWMFFGGSGI